MRYPLLAKLNALPTVAIGAAVGIVVAGILAVVGGSYAHQVVHDQLAPQKISFAPATSPQLPAGIKQYANKPVLDGPTAKVFADKYIAVHLKKIGGGQTYSQVSAKALANPSNQALQQQAQTLFRGEALRGMLLNAWGWGLAGTIALIAGWILIALGSVLLALPIADLLLNRREETETSRAKIGAPAPQAG